MFSNQNNDIYKLYILRNFGSDFYDFIISNKLWLRATISNFFYSFYLCSLMAVRFNVLTIRTLQDKLGLHHQD